MVVRGIVKREEEGCGEGAFACWSAEWVLIHPATLVCHYLILEVSAMLLGSISRFCPFTQRTRAQFLVGSDHMYTAGQPCCIKRRNTCVCCAVYDDFVALAEALEEVSESLQVRLLSLHIGNLLAGYLTCVCGGTE